MSCCRRKELMKNLDYCKHGMKVWGIDYDIHQLLYALRNQVKDYFPLNGVPAHIVQSLTHLQERMDIAFQQLGITVDTIIYELEKIDGLEE